MNLLSGEVSDGVFRCKNVEIAGLASNIAGPMILGYRAEDAELSHNGKGELSGAAYSVELLGDVTMVTIRAGGGFVTVRAPKNFRAAIGSPIHIQVNPRNCHMFDSQSGQRIDAP
jgi:multiple sugar transport system ATP-binding protein